MHESVLVLSSCITKFVLALCISASTRISPETEFVLFIISDFLAAVIVMLLAEMLVCCTEFSNFEFSTVGWSKYFGLRVPELPEPNFLGNLGTSIFSSRLKFGFHFDLTVLPVNRITELNEPYYPNGQAIDSLMPYG